MSIEIPLSFRCGDADLIGVIHKPETPAATGVIIVVGGPQYRSGSHRQFLLLARALADRGIAAMRFDYRGLGDSGGPFAGFESIDDDIGAAVDAFRAENPEIENVVMWGLCDAASAILFYAHADARIAGAVLLNPWVRSEAGYAKTQLRHYYLKRLFSRDLWSKILRLEFNVSDSVGSLSDTVRTATESGTEENPLAGRMAAGLEKFDRPALLIMSGNDLTAREFDDAARASPAWRKLIADGALTRRDLPAADHTFSRREWRDEVAALTIDWIEDLPG